MRHPFAPSLCFLFLLLLLLLHMKCCSGESDCQWTAVVNAFRNLGGIRNVFVTQTHIVSVANIFKELVDSAIDTEDKNAHYLGFPYYLKIDLRCRTQHSIKAIRMAHYTGLRPTVTVSFREPVHAVIQKQEELEIEMTASHYRFQECDSEEVCRMCWYVPMPMMNGSVVMHLLVESFGIGMLVDDKRFAININGFVTQHEGKLSFRIGSWLTNLRNYMSARDPSRPLWYTYQRTPVLILGGIPNSKIVLLSDSEFEDFFPIEMGIDSCWIGSLSCPQVQFSSTIVDTVSTESTLFVRQNQLVYYYTGAYSALFMKGNGSELWTRILNNVCVKKLNPVHFPKNDTEFVIALGGGWQEGEFFLISCMDGVVTASKSLRSGELTVCGFLKTSRCQILWAVFSTQENKIVLLVHDQNSHVHHIVFYFRAEEVFQQVFEIPEFVPQHSDKGFVILLGQEQYTTVPLVARGLALDPLNRNLYVWGNVILQSKDMVSYLYLSNFPSTSFIKYLVLSYRGEFVCVTDNEEIWVSLEGSSDFKRLYPSAAWTVYSILQVMGGADDFAHQHGLVSIFYDTEGLKELVYIEFPNGTEKFVKRPFPLGKILAYDQMVDSAYKPVMYEGSLHIKFTHRCPFATMREVDLPLPQRFTRFEHYFAKPPDIVEVSGFHDAKSLAVYQGLVFQLLWLHSDYNRPYADPVHDPTWRWWKNKKQDSEYYRYVASNRNSSAGIYVDMENYQKFYYLKPNNELPDVIYLDKNNVYTFFVYLSIRTAKQSVGDKNSLSAVWLTVILAHPEYVNARLRRLELISRGAVLYEVSIRDIGLFPRQDLSGKNLLKSSLAMKVARSGLNCYHYTALGPELKGTNVVGVNVGCPPGKRLAFDITGTLQTVSKKNKRYFDCVEKDPEMPCFFYSDVFYPLFLIQDMVTGDSGPFMGSYILKIIGGGAYSEANIRYFNETEILLYNVMNKSEKSSLIWVTASPEGVATKESTDPKGYHIFSHNQSGIVWACQRNSPCYDVSPRGLSAPHYYFVVKVTNRGVDQTTYCDYALEFTIHIHGLRLSPTRAIHLLKISIAVTIGSVVLYVLIYTLGPLVVAVCHRMFRRFEEAFAARIESSLTFSSSFTSQGSLHNFPSSSSDTPSQRLSRGQPDMPLLAHQ